MAIVDVTLEEESPIKGLASSLEPEALSEFYAIFHDELKERDLKHAIGRSEVFYRDCMRNRVQHSQKDTKREHSGVVELGLELAQIRNYERTFIEGTGRMQYGTSLTIQDPREVYAKMLGKNVNFLDESAGEDTPNQNPQTKEQRWTSMIAEQVVPGSSLLICTIDHFIEFIDRKTRAYRVGEDEERKHYGRLKELGEKHNLEFQYTGITIRGKKSIIF